MLLINTFCLLDNQPSYLLNKVMLTQKDLNQVEEIVDRKLDEKFDEKFGLLPTKDEFFGKMDEVMGELKTIREEVEVVSGRVSDHEDRITTLEKICPATP